MVDNLIEKFNSPDFNHEKYVKEISQKCVGDQELQQQRKTISALSELTNTLLKKNVYKNYMQFIETAKEITHLESEMYHLSHLLTEQKSLLEVFVNSNNLNDSNHGELLDEAEKQKKEDEKEKLKVEEDRMRILSSIMEKVEGCTGLLEVKDRMLLHENDLLELDPVDNSIIHKTHAYLFSDALMLTSWITNRRGPVKYKMYAMYNLNSLAVINVRDLKSIDKAFKILAYPDTRLFQCSSTDAKKEWLDRFEQAKKAKLTNEKAKRESNSVDVNDESSMKNISLDSPTSFFEDDSIFSNIIMPEWFLESPEEVDVLIAERHFEDALEVLTKCKDYCQSFDQNEKDPIFLDIKNKIESRRKNLTDVLIKELEISSEKSLQGGLRTARRIVRLLIALNKTLEACELMLKLCSSIMKKELKTVRREGGLFLYVQQSGNIFYSTLLDVVEEFKKIFPSLSACYACLVYWSHCELTHFVSHLIKHVFVPQSSITLVSDCVSSLREQNAELCNYGLDLRYQVDGMLQKPITIALQDAKDKMIEAIKHRSSEEKWHPMNLQNKNNLNKFVQELNDLGLTGVNEYVSGDCWLDLTSNTIAFAKSFLSLLEDCLKLYSAQLHYIIDNILHEIFQYQLRVFQNALRVNNQDSEIRVIDKNLKFLLDNLLKLAMENYKKKTKVSLADLESLKSEFSNLKIGTTKPKPAPRSITKYSSEEFI